jgi:hypothetical protein
MAGAVALFAALFYVWLEAPWLCIGARRIAAAAAERKPLVVPAVAAPSAQQPAAPRPEPPAPQSRRPGIFVLPPAQARDALARRTRP